MKEKFKDKQEELVFLRDWITTILKIYKKEVVPNSSYPDEMMMIEERVFEMKDLRGMRLVYDDMNEGVMEEGGETARLINKALREKFGKDLFDVHKKMAARIATVLKRGKIRTDDEYVRMSEWMDHLDCDDPEDLEEIGRIEKLMCEYEERAAKKLEKKRSHNNK